MLLWTRSCHAGSEKVAVDHARRASASTGLDLVPWVSVYGLPCAAVVYSVQVESQAAMAAALATLELDPGEDSIGEIVSVAGPGGSVGNFASVVLAQCAPGRIAEATAWGVDILSHASKLTGLDGVLVRGLYGPWATLAWIAVAESMDEVDDAAAALAADTSYLERIDDAGPLFLPGSASQRLLRRLS